MKYIGQCIRLATVLATVVVAMTTTFLAAPSTAEACSPPQIAWEFDFSSIAEMEIPADSALIFSGQSATAETPDISVTDDDGTEIEGTTEVIQRHHTRTSETWIECPAEDGWAGYLIVWQPDEPLTPGLSYDLKAAEPGDLDAAQDIEFSVIDAIDTDVEKPEFDDVFVDVDTAGFEYECCECDQCYGGCCETDSNRTCWYISEVDKPRINAEVTGNEQMASSQLLYRVLDEDGETVAEHWQDLDVARVTYPVDATGSHCLSVEVTDLSTGETQSSDETCLEASDELAFGPRDIEWERPEDQCDDSSPDSSDDTGTDLPDAGGPDSESGSSDDDDAGDGGCNTVSGGLPVPLALLLILAWSARRLIRRTDKSDGIRRIVG